MSLQVAPVALWLLPWDASQCFLQLFRESLGWLVSLPLQASVQLPSSPYHGSLCKSSTKQVQHCGTSSGTDWGSCEAAVTCFDPRVSRTCWHGCSTTPPGYDCPHPALSALIPEAPLGCLNSSARRTKCFCALEASPKGNSKQSRLVFQMSHMMCDVAQLLSPRLPWWQYQKMSYVQTTRASGPNVCWNHCYRQILKVFNGPSSRQAPARSTH